MILAMLLYVAVMLLAWPLARGTTSLPLKILLALLPALPMLYVIGLMVRRVRDSDELQQRTHLIALGASTAVVGVASLVGGFLAASGVVHLDGSILTWVFPMMLISYYAAQWWVARHYGNDPSCDGSDGGIPLRWRLLILAVLTGLGAWFAYLRHDALDIGMAIGMGVSVACFALVRGFIYLRRSPVQPDR
ncbi:hypothetical protein ACFPME_06870 [Rhodanobacter umsongensis]|uniref:DUF1453 domain-containing protein n=1 Tax=Rhodanobacter umsongensis TaxID=633153 RepID=A0ABW0JKE6_9GAMM